MEGLKSGSNLIFILFLDLVRSLKHDLANNQFYLQNKNRYNFVTFRRLHDAIIKGRNENKKLTNASSRVTTDLHKGGGYTNTLAWIESVCTFKLSVNCLM